MQVVDIYCRTATYDSETYTKLRQQETTCRDYCTKHGLSIDMIHFEVAGGLTYYNRELLQLLRNRYRNGKIQAVVITYFDRLTRNHDHLAILMSEMEAYGITLHCVNMCLEDSVMGRLIRLILDHMTEAEKKQLLNMPPIVFDC